MRFFNLFFLISNGCTFFECYPKTMECTLAFSLWLLIVRSKQAWNRLREKRDGWGGWGGLVC